MERITYGAPGYMDWLAQIKAGAARVRVHFTGGALTVYGVTPAEYTTDNAFIQKAIEKSEYYKAGRIVKLRATLVESGERRVESGASAGLGAGSAEHGGSASVESGASRGLGAESAEHGGSASVESGERRVESGAAGLGAESAEHEGSASVESVKVSCLQDAQAYIQEHFGISSYKVRTEAAAQKIAAEHGIEFRF